MFVQNDTSKHSCLHNTTLLVGLSQNNYEEQLFNVVTSVRQSVILCLSRSINIEIYGFCWTELCDILYRVFLLKLLTTFKFGVNSMEIADIFP